MCVHFNCIVLGTLGQIKKGAFKNLQILNTCSSSSETKIPLQTYCTDLYKKIFNVNMEAMQNYGVGLFLLHRIYYKHYLGDSETFRPSLRATNKLFDERARDHGSDQTLESILTKF